ncbi:MAG TPA: CpsD/CapB family tyrosine-protein kinase [Candidatus Acidoferrum sp.]|nr:CpsD/CapB family tyrosine-protein kinase [Candidatus Acidoferrum sp.]
MSKNFELLQQVDTNGGAAVAPQASAPTAFHAGNGNGHAARLSLDGVAHEETLRLVQSIFLTAGQNPPRVVVFSGIDAGNGCSHVCAQAAAVLAGNVTGSVCLVDANLRTPSLPEFFGVTNHHGLTDSLRGNGSIRGYAKPLRPENLWLLSSGSLAADSSALLNSELMKARIAELRKEFDYVLIDSPPLNTYSDGIVLGQLSDGVVMVLEANSTRREAALRVAESLRARQIKVLGAVLNKRTFPIPESLYHRL